MVSAGVNASLQSVVVYVASAGTDTASVRQRLYTLLMQTRKSGCQRRGSLPKEAEGSKLVMPIL